MRTETSYILISSFSFTHSLKRFVGSLCCCSKKTNDDSKWKFCKKNYVSDGLDLFCPSGWKKEMLDIYEDDFKLHSKRICNTTQQKYWQTSSHEYEFSTVCMTKALSWSQLQKQQYSAFLDSRLDSDQKVCTQFKSFATLIRIQLKYLKFLANRMNGNTWMQ